MVGIREGLRRKVAVQNANLIFLLLIPSRTLSIYLSIFLFIYRFIHIISLSIDLPNTNITIYLSIYLSI